MRCFLTTLLTLAILASSSLAEYKTASPVQFGPESKEPSSIYDKIWKLAELYNNPQNPILQEVKLQGYFIWTYAYGDSNEGHFGSKDRPSKVRYGDIEFRLWQMGIRTK